MHNLFWQWLGVPGKVPQEYGSWLSELERLRLQADYPNQWDYEDIAEEEARQSL